MIYDDVTVTIASGTYLFEHKDRLVRDGETAKADATQASIDLMCRYLPNAYPGFLVCGGPPLEATRYMELENEKVKRDLADGTISRPPTRAEWEARVAPTRDSLIAEYRNELPQAMFRVSKGGRHQGAIHFSSIHTLSTDRGVTNLNVLVSMGLGVGATDVDVWHRISMEMMIYFLRNPFLATNDDPRTFQFFNVRLPNMYTSLRVRVNAEAISLLRSERIWFDEYPKHPDQISLGIETLRDMRLVRP